MGIRFLSLHRPFPNPFNPSVTLMASLSRPAELRLQVFDVAGRLVTTLAQGHHSLGRHEFRWSGVDDHGRSVGSGVYLVRLATPEAQATRSIVLLR